MVSCYWQLFFEDMAVTFRIWSAISEMLVNIVKSSTVYPYIPIAIEKGYMKLALNNFCPALIVITARKWTKIILYCSSNKVES